MVRSLEEQTGTRIALNKEPVPRMVVRGTPESRALAWKLVQDLLSADGEVNFPLKDRDARLVIGPGGATIRYIEAQTGASLSIDRANNSMVRYVHVYVCVIDLYVSL